MLSSLVDVNNAVIASPVTSNGQTLPPGQMIILTQANQELITKLIHQMPVIPVIAATGLVSTPDSSSSSTTQLTASIPEVNRVKPHVCPYSDCGKMYYKSSHLKAHVRTHTGICYIVLKLENILYFIFLHR